jgi:hypothetical protein
MVPTEIEREREREGYLDKKALEFKTLEKSSKLGRKKTQRWRKSPTSFYLLRQPKLQSNNKKKKKNGFSFFVVNENLCTSR